MFRFLLVAACLLAGPAFAHVTANPDKGTAGKYFETKLRISHGCEGSDTVEIQVSLPKGFVTAKPQYKPGWTATVIKSKLDKPVPAGHGKMADEQIDQIIWKGGPLPHDQYDEFGLLVKLPDGPGIVWLPVKQTCVKGVEDWKNVPAGGDWHSTDHPAPFVKIEADTSAPAHHH